MQYRRFGKTELKTSVMTFGCMQLPETTMDEVVETVHYAVSQGINHLETARGYADSEIRLRTALEGLKREDLIITTKVTPEDTGDAFRRVFDESMERIGLDYLDILDIHGINHWALLEQTIKKGGPLDVAHRLIDEGVIGHIGFSGHAPLEVILAAINTEAFETVNLHYYYILQRNLPAIQRANELDMGVFIISPSDKGGQLYKAPAKLRELTKPLTPLQFNHRFMLSNPAIHTVTIGCKYPHEFAEHLAVADNVGPLTDEEKAIIEKLDRQYPLSLGKTWCTECWECVDYCPEGIVIPDVLRCRNLAIAFDMDAYAKYRYGAFGNIGHWCTGPNGAACTECGDCLPHCPEKLNIPALLFETHDRCDTGGRGRRFE